MANEFDEIHFPSADGRLRLYARDYPGAGPPLLMMHGLTRNSADFAALAAALAGRYRIIVPDQRGRGRSDFDPDPARYGLDDYRADMGGLIERLGLDRPVLIGTSLGGLMAMVMASRAPDRFRGLILNDVGPAVDPAGLRRIASYVGRVVAVERWEDAAAYCRETNGAAFPGYRDADWRAFARRLFFQGEDGRPRLAYDPAIAGGLERPPLGPAPADLWPQWAALAPLPMLALRGALSDVLGEATLEAMRAGHPGLRIATIPGVGHAPMLDEPEALAAIEAFLGDLTRAAA